MRFYFRFCPVEGCMSVNMFTFEADDEIHQCRRWCVTRASPLAVGAIRGISPCTYTPPPSEGCRWQGLGQSKGASVGNQNCHSTVASLHIGSTASIRSIHDTILGISDGRVRPPRAR